jgi:osmoprotectant transport system substrate-binding protein
MIFHKSVKLIGALGAAALLATACSSGGADKVSVGAFNFTESQILAELYAGVLQEAGIDVTIQQSTNREVLGPALESGEVQVVPEYLGTYTEFLNRSINGPDAPVLASGDVELTWVEGRSLAEARGVTLLDPSPAADQNAFAVTRAFAEANGLRSLSDLAAYSQTAPVVLGGPAECPDRLFCQVGLEERYGMVIGEFIPLDAGGPLTKQAIEQGTIQLGLVFSSDGGVAALDLAVLEDDLALQQVDNIVPAVLTSALTPAIADALNALSAALTTNDLIAMNKAVDIDRQTPAQVATAFLKDKGLIAS